ncbi:MAG: alpha/beta hydrolase [Lysobacter sp.]
MTSDKGRDYAIRLHLPQGDPPAGGHALVWLLDAPTTWAPMQHALHEAGDGGVAVIGIDWDEPGGVDPNLRRRDFTRPARHPVRPLQGDAGPWREDGDADAFLAFLTGTLQPHYLQALAVDPARQALVGHSLSGLFVLQALLARPDRFQRYVAVSPSIWWDEARILADVSGADRLNAGDARVLVTVGSEEQVAGPEKPPEIDGEDEAAMLGEPHMVDYASGFARSLRQRGVDCAFDLIEGETHTSVIPAAMALALRFCRDGVSA